MITNKEIYFKAKETQHDSGFANLKKWGDLKFDIGGTTEDGIWLLLKEGSMVFIDCDFKTKTFKIAFNGDDFRI